MAEQNAWRTAHYSELPQGDVLSDYLTDFWLISDVFDIENVSISMGTISPNEAGPMHKHEPPIEEIYICFDGKVDHDVMDPATNEVETITAERGTVSYFPPGVPHRPNNRYDSPAVQIAIRSQGGSSEEMEEGQTVVDGDE